MKCARDDHGPTLSPMFLLWVISCTWSSHVDRFGSPNRIQAITCAVDAHKRHLKIRKRGEFLRRQTLSRGLVWCKKPSEPGQVLQKNRSKGAVSQLTIVHFVNIANAPPFSLWNMRNYFWKIKSQHLVKQMSPKHSYQTLQAKKMSFEKRLG